jgi:hypothetical protein
MKQADGTYKNYTVSISDETDQYGNNVAMFVRQTKEERESKAKRTYVGNGKVMWTDGTINKADKKDPPVKKEEIVNDDLPF